MNKGSDEAKVKGKMLVTMTGMFVMMAMNIVMTMMVTLMVMDKSMVVIVILGENDDNDCERGWLR